MLHPEPPHDPPVLTINGATLASSVSFSATSGNSITVTEGVTYRLVDQAHA